MNRLIVDYPHWLRRCIFFTATIHDVAIIVAGIFALQEQPRSILFSLDDTFKVFWATMFITGGTIALIGLFSRNIRFETTGCVLTVGAKVVWVVAALRPGIDIIGTETLAAILVAGASGTMWRVWGLYVGQYLKVRE